MKSNYSRRKFIQNSILATTGVVLASNFISCANDDLNDNPIQIPTDLTAKNFEQGVASFDPQSTQVIIWTRYNTQEPSAQIVWQLSKNFNFSTIERSGEVITDSSRDFTISIELQGLEENQKWYYRFINIADKATSPVGETITLPSTGLQELNLAIASCANFQAGLFNVYDAMANSNADIIIHLGDYIYEYGANSYGTNTHTAMLNRIAEPQHEIITLNDYRIRYKQYRSDNSLKLAHQKKPFICIWDDHEITNDTYKDGANNHNPGEGDFETRKQHALQAYSEYLPAKTNDINIIYRAFNFGGLANLIMLDTRLVGRDKQLDYANYFDSTGNFNINAFQSDWLNPNRTMLGASQKNWFLNEINSSTAIWNIIGQQVLMAKMLIPAELLIVLSKIIAEISATGSVSSATNAQFQTQLRALVFLKLRVLNNDPSLTQEERARIQTVLPYNLDAWDGYPTEREELLHTFKDKKVVVLAGDTHNAWQSTLKLNNTTEEVAQEIATTSVSSPGFEALLPGNAQTILGFEQAITTLINDLNYFDAKNRGFVSVNITPATVTAKWEFVDTLLTESYSTTTGHTFLI